MLLHCPHRRALQSMPAAVPVCTARNNTPTWRIIHDARKMRLRSLAEALRRSQEKIRSPRSALLRKIIASRQSVSSLYDFAAFTPNGSYLAPLSVLTFKRERWRTRQYGNKKTGTAHSAGACSKRRLDPPSFRSGIWRADKWSGCRPAPWRRPPARSPYHGLLRRRAFRVSRHRCALAAMPPARAHRRVYVRRSWCGHGASYAARLRLSLSRGRGR